VKFILGTTGGKTLYMLALNCLCLSFYRVLVSNPCGEAHQEWRREFALPRNRQICRLAKRDSPVPPRTYDGQMARLEAEPSLETFEISFIAKGNSVLPILEAAHASFPKKYCTHNM
jgi:hypothetical protein